MKEIFVNTPLNKTDKRFELKHNGHTAFIDYINKADRIALIHTEAPAELAGTGAAAALVEKTLIWLEDNQIPLIPICPYVKKFISKNREWLRIVDEPYKTKID